MTMLQFKVFTSANTFPGLGSEVFFTFKAGRGYRLCSWKSYNLFIFGIIYKLHFGIKMHIKFSLELNTFPIDDKDLNTNNICEKSEQNSKNGILRWLKHIFRNTYQRIKSICSPAKVGLVVIDLITSPVVSWRGVGDTPPPPPQAPRLSCHSLHDLERGQRGGR